MGCPPAPGSVLPFQVLQQVQFPFRFVSPDTEIRPGPPRDARPLGLGTAPVGGSGRRECAHSPTVGGTGRADPLSVPTHPSCREAGWGTKAKRRCLRFDTNAGLCTVLICHPMEQALLFSSRWGWSSPPPKIKHLVEHVFFAKRLEGTLFDCVFSLFSTGDPVNFFGASR